MYCVLSVLSLVSVKCSVRDPVIVPVCDGMECVVCPVRAAHSTVTGVNCVGW